MLTKKAPAWLWPAGVAATGIIAGLMYGAFIFGTSQDGVANVPPQDNSVILSTLSVLTVTTAVVASTAWLLCRWGGALRRDHARDLAAIRQELLMLSPTQPLRIVATAPVPSSEAIAQAYIDGATARANVLPLARRS